MPDVPGWVQEEEELVTRVVPSVRAIQAEDRAHEERLVREGRQLQERLAELRGDPIQRQALEEAADEKLRLLRSHRAANKSASLDAGSPCFAHFRVKEDGRRRDVLLGKATLLRRGELPCSIVDWRHGPISRLFYEYEEGDEYEEEINGQEREGVLEVRRALDIRGGVLQEVRSGQGEVARRRAGHRWELVDSDARRENDEDHRLPEVLSLITPDQWELITREDAGVILLRGQAGSGKTTVALHRLSWLSYQHGGSKWLGKTLVLMYNKALQSYVRRALVELDLEGARVETWHAWALAQLRAVGLSPELASDCPPELRRLKRHPAMLGALEAYVALLGERLEAWLPAPPELADLWRRTPRRGYARLRTFWPRVPQAHRALSEPLREKVEARLGDHLRDVWALLQDSELLSRHLPSDSPLKALAARAAEHASRGRMDFEDVALALRLGQLKAQADPGFDVPWLGRLAHVVIDEAQDLSLLELATAVQAADDARSVTIAGDPAQAIYQELSREQFDGLVARLSGASSSLEVLGVGHRSTRPIMAYALEVLGRGSEQASGREGPPVEHLAGQAATAQSIARILGAFRATRPKALVAVICRTKREADQWHAELAATGLSDLRRAERAGFTFLPGVVVSNAHQVKGLEFDGVVLVAPGSYPWRDRKLLHVAITRAADRLWVVYPSNS